MPCGTLQKWSAPFRCKCERNSRDKMVALVTPVSTALAVKRSLVPASFMTPNSLKVTASFNELKLIKVAFRCSPIQSSLTQANRRQLIFCPLQTASGIMRLCWRKRFRRAFPGRIYTFRRTQRERAHERTELTFLSVCFTLCLFIFLSFQQMVNKKIAKQRYFFCVYFRASISGIRRYSRISTLVTRNKKAK